MEISFLPLFWMISWQAQAISWLNWIVYSICTDRWITKVLVTEARGLLSQAAKWRHFSGVPMSFIRSWYILIYQYSRCIFLSSISVDLYLHLHICVYHLACNSLCTYKIMYILHMLQHAGNMSCNSFLQHFLVSISNPFCFLGPSRNLRCVHCLSNN